MFISILFVYTQYVLLCVSVTPAEWLCIGHLYRHKCTECALIHNMDTYIHMYIGWTCICIYVWKRVCCGSCLWFWYETESGSPLKWMHCLYVMLCFVVVVVVVAYSYMHIYIYVYCVYSMNPICIYTILSLLFASLWK